MSKPKKLVEEKNLSGLGGVYDVSFGAAPPERRAQGDYSKAGVSHAKSDTFDDYREKQERYDKLLGVL
jgi:hypothetical protein